MNEHLGRHVKCFLRNSTVVEGIMESCTGAIQLRSLDGESLLIIHHPEQDIVLTKVLLPEEATDEPEKETQDLQPLPPSEEEADPMALKAKSIAELKIEMAKQERKIVANKLRDHVPDLSQPRKVTYGQPRFFQKPSAK